MKKRPNSVARGLLWLLALSLLFAGGALLWFNTAAYGDRSLPAKETDVVIPKGSTFAQIAALLQKNGVIADLRAFRILAKIEGAEARARAGEFRFAGHESNEEILHALISGGAEVAQWVSIPEGYTARQIAQTLSDHELGDAGRFADAFLRDSTTIAGQRTKNLEGFLFPSTYLVARDAEPAQVAALMLEQFRRELPGDAASAAKAHGLTIPQVVTLASLIEREAKSDDERALMAGVYYNRLRLNMPLQVDATIEYALPAHKTELSRADLAIDSPYNTYKYPGLPPTPIANPGKPSLEGAFHPRASDFLYYVYMGNGHHAFARSLAEHNANVAKYLH